MRSAKYAGSGLCGRASSNRRTDGLKRMWIGLSVMLAAVLLVSTACSSKSATTTAATTTKVTTTAATTSPTVTALPVTTTAANAIYPMTVTDISGRTVTVSKKPVSIVTTSPTATEALYKVGGTAVGRDTSSRYPPEAQSVPTVGSVYTLSVEAIAALKPDLIIIEALTQSHMLPALEKLGAPVLAVRAASLDDVVQGLTIVGKVINADAAAAKAVADIKARIEAAKKTTRAGRNILIFTFDASSKVYGAKPESYPGTLAALLGQKNLAAGMPENAPFPGFSLFTGEQALSSNPDAVFCISPAPAPAPTLSSLLPQLPGFKDMPAVKAGKVKELDPALFLQAQGPRIADAAEQLAKLLNEVAP